MTGVYYILYYNTLAHSLFFTLSSTPNHNTALQINKYQLLTLYRTENRFLSCIPNHLDSLQISPCGTNKDLCFYAARQRTKNINNTLIGDCILNIVSTCKCFCGEMLTR